MSAISCADGVGLGVERLLEPAARAAAAELPLGVGVDEAGVGRRVADRHAVVAGDEPRARGQGAGAVRDARGPADARSRSPPRSSAVAAERVGGRRGPRVASQLDAGDLEAAHASASGALGFRGARGLRSSTIPSDGLASA